MFAVTNLVLTGVLLVAAGGCGRLRMSSLIPVPAPRVCDINGRISVIHDEPRSREGLISNPLVEMIGQNDVLTA